MKQLAILFACFALVLAGCGELANQPATPTSDLPVNTPTQSPTEQPTELPTLTPEATASPSPSADLESVGGLPYSDSMLMDGQINYSIFCQACHGPDAKGLPSLGLDLTASQVLHKSTDEELLEFIIVGRAIDDPANTTGVAMPPRAGFPNLTDEQIMTIIAHLRSISE